MYKKLIFIVCLGTFAYSSIDMGVINTGGQKGTYIQMGQDISTLLKKYDVTLGVKDSKGSVDNLRRIVGLDESHQSDWAIVQSDALKYFKYQYYQETKSNLNDKVKVVLPLYNEDILILTKKNKKISFNSSTLINVGVKSKKSGGYITSKIISNSYGVKFKYQFIDFETAKDYLEDGFIDIFIDVTAKPHEMYRNLKNIDFVILPDNKIMDQNYQKIILKKRDYQWLDKDTSGYTCPSVLVTSLVDTQYDRQTKFFIEAILRNNVELKRNGHNRWSEVFENLKDTSNKFNYHPQALDRIIFYQKNR